MPRILPSNEMVLEGLHCFGTMFTPHKDWRSLDTIGAWAQGRIALSTAHGLIGVAALFEVMGDYAERYVRICTKHSLVFLGEFCGKCGQLTPWYVGDSWTGRLVCQAGPKNDAIRKAVGRFMWGREKESGA